MKTSAQKILSPSMEDPLSSKGQLPASHPYGKKTHTPDEPRPSLIQSIRSWLRSTLLSRGDASLKEVLEEVIEEHEEQTQEGLEPEEKVMLHNVLSFGDIMVSDIMVPRTDISAVPSNISLDDLKSHILEQRHTRVPVYEETLDHVIGFIHVKDLLPMLSGSVPFELKKVLRKMLFVPPSMRLIDLLVKMRGAGSHIALVIDEHGGTDGMVTMEDVFEEIVGDIHDEHDEDEEQDNQIQYIGHGSFEVSGRIRLETLEKQLALTLTNPEKGEEFDTLGGLLSFRLGHVPVKGEKIDHESGVIFEVIDSDPRRIRKVRIQTKSS
jgi:magnesium and cobalt transporter